ncbi:MAG: glycogen-binding domain-containing protein [Gemmatimonadaceae bacterium]
MRPIVVAAGLLAGSIVAPAAEAQIVGALDVSGFFRPAAGRAWLAESQFASTLRWDGASAFAHVDAAFNGQAGLRALEASAARVVFTGLSVGRLRLSVEGRLAGDPTPPADGSSAAAAIATRIGAGGLWLGASTGRGGGGGPTIGAWRMIRSAVLTLTTTSRSVAESRFVFSSRQVVFFDTISTDSVVRVERTEYDSSSATGMRRWSEMEARMDWGAGRLLVSAALAGRKRVDSTHRRVWGRVNATVQLEPRVALLASAGTMSIAPPSSGQLAGFASVGLRFSRGYVREPLPAPVRPVPTSLAFHRVEQGHYRITLRVPGARAVEVAGEFNGWTPVVLEETAPNQWEVTLALTPGLYRMNVRVNGDAWTAPPGVPAMDDEFNGRVGVVTVR